MASHLFLSLELVYLFGWLLKNEKSKINDLVKEALKNGLDKELATIKPTEKEMLSDELYNTFIEFIDCLEDSLHENLDKKNKNKTIKKQLNKTLNKINLKLNDINAQTIWLALNQAEDDLRKKSIKDRTEKETNKTLLDKILENWEPQNKDEVN